MKFPDKCPFCHKDIKENMRQASSPVKIGNFYYRSEIHACFHCSMPLFSYRECFFPEFDEKTRIIQTFPLPTPSVSIPPHVAHLSPDASQTYSQAIQAQEFGYDRLVGAGLRKTLEWLMFDYLVKLKGIPASDLESKRLVDLIKMVAGHNQNQYTDICAKLIRLYGNDHVHLFPKTDLSDDEIITAFQILFEIIEAEIIVLNANNRLEGLPEII